MPRLEIIFRKQRENKIEEIKRELDEAEKSGGNAAAAFQKAGMRPDVYYQNLTEEEKEAQWKARWELPQTSKLDEKHEYEHRIANNRKIQNKQFEILAGIEKISESMDDDRKHWQANDDVRALYNIRTDRGKRRILKGNQGQLDQDPVQGYRQAIENIVEVLSSIKGTQPQKAEQFIILDCSKLKNSLNEYGNDFILQIFQHLILESKQELNSLLNEFTTTIDELKQPPSNLQQLKKNRDLFDEVKSKLAIFDQRREPIKRKFQYIQEQDQDIGVTELTDDDKAKLDGLDDAWAKFQDGLEDANLIIAKCNQ